MQETSCRFEIKLFTIGTNLKHQLKYCADWASI